MLGSHMAYISSMLYRTAATPKIMWNADYTVVTYQEYSLSLAHLRSGLKKLFTELEKEIASLTGGIEADIPVDFQLENLSNGSRDYSFLGLPQFAEQYKPVLQRLMDPAFELCIADLDITGKLHWRQGNCMKIMERLDSIIRKIAVVAYIVPSQPPRGTEFTQWRISNQDLMRNVYYIYGICFVNIQLKTTNLKEALDFIPMFCPLRLSKIISNYLILLRGIEIILSQQITHLVEDNCADVYQEYFLVSLGKHLDADTFGRIFGDFTWRYFGVRLGRRSWRHMAKALKREFVPAMYHKYILDEDIGDQAAGHGSFEAARTYARVQGELGFVTTDRMHEFRKFSEAWHNVLHLGTQLPPQAISLRKSGQWSTTNNNANQSISMDDVEEEEPINTRGNSSNQVEAHVPIHAPQQIMEQMRTTMENTVKESIQAICTKELDSVKVAIHDAFAKGITDFHAALNTILNNANAMALQHGDQNENHPPSNNQPPNPPLIQPQNSQHAIRSQPPQENALVRLRHQRALVLTPTPRPRLSASTPPPAGSELQRLSQWAVPPGRPSSFELPSVPSSSSSIHLPSPSSSMQLPSSSLPMPTPTLPADHLLELLRMSLRDPYATFRSPIQEQVVQLAVERNESFICIMPTGGGKSTLWSVPVQDFKEINLITIVLEPYLSLITDQVQRLRSQGVNAGVWNADNIDGLHDIHVMFASFEHMGTVGFRS